MNPVHFRFRRDGLTVLYGVLALSFFSAATSQSGHAIQDALIPLLTCSWDHVSLSVIIEPGNGITGYSASQLDAVRAGIDSWRSAVEVWVDRFGDPYLRQIQFTVYVLGTNATSSLVAPGGKLFDVDVSFLSSVADPQELGGARVCLKSGNPTPLLTSVGILTELNGNPLDSHTIQSVTAHEFGHVLGLGHATREQTDDGSRELMYYSTSLGALTYPSSLDVYALSLLYSWLPKGAFSRPLVTSVTLPSSVAYTELKPYPQQIADRSMELGLLREELSLVVLVGVAISVSVCLTVFFFTRRHYRSMSPRLPLEQSTALPSSKGQPSTVVVDHWTVCPKCGAFISAEINTCSCGASLKKRR